MISEITIKIALDAGGNLLTVGSDESGEASYPLPGVPRSEDTAGEQAIPPVPEADTAFLETEVSSSDIPPPESEDFQSSMEGEVGVPGAGELAALEENDIPPPTDPLEENEELADEQGG